MVKEKALEPLENRVLVVALDEKVSKGGICLPDNMQKDGPMRARVVAVGPGTILEGACRRFDGEVQVVRVPMTVKPGDHVLVSAYDWKVYEIEIDGEKCSIVLETSILARIPKE